MKQRMTTRISTALTGAVVASVILVGCATDHEVNRLSQSVDDHYNEGHKLAANRGALVTATANAFLAGDAIEAPPQRAAILNQEITYVTTIPVNVTEVASFVAQEVGVQVDVSALQAAAPGVSPIMNAIVSNQNGAGPKEVWVTLRHTGPLYQLLDQVGSKTNSWWTLADGQVRFYRTVTQTFTLAEVPQAQTRKTTIDTTNSGASTNGASGGSGSSGSSSGGGGSQSSGASSGLTSSVNVSVDPWKDIKDNATAVAGSARISIDSMSGTVTVTGSPAEVRQVGEWVKSYNRIASQQVQVSMDVYKVELDHEDNYGISPNIIFQNLAGRGWAFNGIQLPSTVTTTTPGKITAQIASASSGYTGSKLAVQALSTLGKVSETFSSSNVTKNGHPAVFVNGNSIGYLYEVSTLLSANVGQEATLTPGTVNTGVSWMATPRIVDGVVHMSVAISDGTLVSLTTVSSGQNSIQTPNVNVLALQNDVILHPGDALLLAGMDDSNGASTHNGIGSAQNPVLGGGYDANTKRSIIAIVMTAKVL